MKELLVRAAEKGSKKLMELVVLALTLTLTLTRIAMYAKRNSTNQVMELASAMTRMLTSERAATNAS